MRRVLPSVLGHLVVHGRLRGSAAVIPLLAFGGAVSFGAKAGCGGAFAGALLGGGVGAALLWLWVRLTEAPNEPTLDLNREAPASGSAEPNGSALGTRNQSGTSSQSGTSPDAYVGTEAQELVGTGSSPALAEVDAAVARGDLEHAITICEQLRGRFPADPLVPAYHSRLLAASGRPHEAVLLLGEAIQIAVLVGDLDAATDLVLEGRPHWDRLPLEGSTAVVVGENAAQRADRDTLRFCLDRAREGSVSSHEIRKLERALND
jgi:hypothetical protein